MEYLLGVVISIIVEFIKKKGDTTSIGTGVVLLGGSLLVAAGFVWLRDSEFWPTIVPILTTAAAFHNLVIRNFHVPTNKGFFEKE